MHARKIFWIVKYLVDQGANMHAKARYNFTPLHNACYSGNLDIVKYLVEQGADVKIINIKSRNYSDIINDYLLKFCCLIIN